MKIYRIIDEIIAHIFVFDRAYFHIFPESGNLQNVEGAGASWVAIAALQGILLDMAVFLKNSFCSLYGTWEGLVRCKILLQSVGTICPYF